ncbi:AF4/FMR2 family member 4 isoform X2 [Ceratitis capitata]|uniref:AF4/FMR2 family member 4 isoform X2 n=1 Tax=Ceratitis capitata TaxID=7213 RepID=UPI00032976C5|nr:AF4/FMR2 family member 4 isoform X2 [Ceratitis capitata]
MDMKKIPKSRIEDFERRQQREREKHKRQQVQSVGREHALFPEPRRVNPSEVDDDITAKLGDHSKAIEFMTTDAVGVQPSSNNALLASHIQTSASSSVGGSTAPLSATSSTSQRLISGLPPQQTSQQSHHYQQQQQQQVRQLPYLKQSDNQQPYNGRGGYPGPQVKSDMRSSGGMAPPKGPPPLLPPPTSTITTSGISSNIGTSSNSNTTASLLPPPSNGYLGPPKSTSSLHNGRFPKPLPKSINDIISKVDQTYRAPEQITKIAATPRTSIGEYNLNGPNRHKYSVGPIQPILGSPPSGVELLKSPMPITSISAVSVPSNLPVISNASAIPSIGSSNTSSISTTEVTTVMANAPLTTTEMRSVMPMLKQPVKPLLDKVGPTLEKQNSTLENDLELSESDDDRRKQSRSVHNSSDSSPSDSSESGSDESSKSEHQRSTAITKHPQQSSAQHQKLNALHTMQQQQPPVQQHQPGRPVMNKSINDKVKVIESLGTARSNIYLNANVLGSAGSSNSGLNSTSSSSNKTPSPSDSSKWNLSRYFNKKPAQAQNDTPPPVNSLVVNSINVSMDEPTLLPGGAQIIPEATQSQPNTAIVKHETTYVTSKKFSNRSDDGDEGSAAEHTSDVRNVTSNLSNIKSNASGSVPALLNEIKKESDILYPTPLLKATSSNTSQIHVVSQQQQQQQQQSQVPLLNAAEFVAIPTSQIKHEVPALPSASTSTVAPMSLAGGTTTVTPYSTSSIKASGNGHRRTPSVSPRLRNSVTTGPKIGEFGCVGQLSAPSSDGHTSNSSDDENQITASARSTVPTLGPGGTLKIPGVPAAITALPPSPPQPMGAPPTIPNSITVMPINSLTTITSTRRRKKPRNSTTTITHLDTSDEEEIATATPDFKSSHVTVSPVELRAAAGPGGKLYSEPVPMVAVKKGPGRPRKVTGSGKITNASSSVTAGKGPKLTATKDVGNSSTLVTKKTTAKRRVSRQNSSSVQNLSSKSKTQIQMSSVTRAPSVDSSSSSSTSNSTSKSSSSSSSETEAEDGVISGSSSDNENDSISKGLATKKRNSSAETGNNAPASTSRIIVQLNKRKSSHEDNLSSATTSVASSGKSKTAESGKRRRTASQFTQPHEEADSDDDLSDSGSGSYDSSVRNYVGTTANSSSNMPTTTLAANSTGGSSHRSQNLQSPYKVPIPAALVSSSSSSSSNVSSSSSSSSSGGEHSDTERNASLNNRVKGKHVKTSAKVAVSVNSGSNSARLRRDKPKASDKNKNVTLTRIFNPKEGGAKKQGQVLVIDEQQQQKLISPNSCNYRTAATGSSALSASQENLVAAGTVATLQSPRLTPGHIKSPRAAPQPVTAGSHRTPDHSSRSSAERKVQQSRIKTPSCTPTRTSTPTPAALLSAPTVSPIRTVTTPMPNFPSLICKVDLSRLQRILPEWRTNTYRLSSMGPSPMTRYAHHEAILNADLQATSALATGNSGNITPYSTGNRTPTTPQCPPDRELSRSRESLVGIGVVGNKQRLSSMHSNGRMSSRSTDGAGSDGTMPKDPAQRTPNGYTSVANVSLAFEANNSPSTKQLLKREQLIKNEPGSELDSAALVTAAKTDAYCAETKFKTSGSVKEELIVHKHDFKPGLPTNAFVSAEKEADRLGTTPPSQLRINDITESKSRRKRSASSSPYKEKKRKKDKTEKYSKDGKEVKEGKESVVIPNPTNSKDKEKDVGKSIGAIERDIENSADISCRGIAVIPAQGTNNSEHTEDQPNDINSRQLPHTNHDRLLVDHQLHRQQQHQQQQQQQQQSASLNYSAFPADLQTSSNNIIVPAIGDVNTASTAPSGSGRAPLLPPPQVIYRSYFERDDDGVCDISKNSKFLQEAVKRKHAADKEQNLFNQVTLYLEAVTYFILSGAVLEQHRNSEDASWVMYKDTLNLIKFISSKIKHLQVSSTANELHEPHNKVAILSLRCQSLISLKLYKLKRHYCRSIINHCADLLKSGRMEVINGNTLSSNSPSNSVCSQGSGSNTPPGRVVRQDTHTTLSHQNLYFNYLANCHDLWDQADRLVRQGNHTDFFIALDHENGPLTLHTSMYDLFRYVQSGLKKLKSANITATTNVNNTVTMGNSGGSGEPSTDNSSVINSAAGSNTITINTITTTNKCSNILSKLQQKPQ